jgi:hypothetical protein
LETASPLNDEEREDRLLDEMRDLQGELDDTETSDADRRRIEKRIKRIEGILGEIYGHWRGSA